MFPSYEGALAVSNDTLVGEIETSLFTTIGERLDPIQSKVENIIVSADTLFRRLSNVLDAKTTVSIQQSIKNLEYTILEVRGTLKAINSIVDSSATTIKNTNAISANLEKITDTLANANVGELMQKTNQTLTSMNILFEKINRGEGSLGKLVNDEGMYTNIENATKELEELLREMKLHPKRFVHFSLFGKKPKPYEKASDK